MFPALFWKLLLAVPHGQAPSLLPGSRSSRISHLGPARPCQAWLGRWVCPAAWGAFHCFLECFLNGLWGLAEINLLVSSPLSWWLLCTTALPVPKRGEVFLLHPLDWPVAVTGCWFIHYFAVAPFYLSVLLFFPHADRLNWRVWILPDLWWP